MVVRVAIALALCIVAATAVVATSSEHQQLVNNMAQSATALQSAFRQHLDTQAVPVGEFHLPELSAVSVTCAAALTALQTQYTSLACTTLFAGLGIETSGAGATQSSVDDFCTSDCFTGLETKVADVSAQCSASADDRAIFTATTYANFLVQFRRASFFAKGICVQNAAKTKYCWPQLSVMSSLALSGLTLATQTTVATACDDECNAALVTSVNTFGYPALLATVRAANLYCVKVDSLYCAPVVKSLLTDIVTRDSAGRPVYTTLCTPCVSAWLRQVNVAVDQLSISISFDVILLSALAPQWNYLCTKAADGSYCFDKVLALQTAGDTSFTTSACIGVLSNSTCSADCKAAVIAMDAKLGCCLSSSFYVVAAGAGRSFIEGKCGVELSDCAGKVVKGAVRVKNFLYAYYSANSAAIKAALAADIALKFALSVDQVVITSVSDSTTTASVGISASFTITPATTTAATTIQATFSAVFTQDSSMPATSEAGGESAKSDPAASTSADTTATTSTVETNPNADSNAASPVAAAPVVALAAVLVSVAALF